MKNATVDAINELLEESIITDNSEIAQESIHGIWYLNESQDKYENFCIKKCYRDKYYKLLKKVYNDKIKQRYTYKTVDKKFYGFLHDMKVQHGQITPKHFSRFCNSLSSAEIVPYEIFHKISGVIIDNEYPVQYRDFTLYNTMLHLDNIFEKLETTSDTQYGEWVIEHLREHDYWISVVCMASEVDKAKEEAYRKFELFQGVCRYMLPFMGNVYYIGILDDLDFAFDDYCHISKGSFGAGSKRISGRYEDLNIMVFDYEKPELFQWFLEVISRTPETELSRRISNAIILYSRAEQDMLPTQKYLLYMMAIEALIEMDEDSVVEQVSDYVSTIFSMNLDAKSAIKREFKKMYTIRSEIAHGSEVYISENDVYKAHFYARNIIYQFYIEQDLKICKTNNELKDYIERRKQEMGQTDV